MCLYKDVFSYFTTLKQPLVAEIVSGSFIVKFWSLCVAKVSLPPNVLSHHRCLLCHYFCPQLFALLPQRVPSGLVFLPAELCPHICTCQYGREKDIQMRIGAQLKDIGGKLWEHNPVFISTTSHKTVKI